MNYYYDTLQKSSWDWHEEESDYEPFVKYMLGILIATYREFETRTQMLEKQDIEKNTNNTNVKFRKIDLVEDIIKNTLGKISKSEILEQCKTVSDVTVQRSLKTLVENEKIIKIGGGRYTYYVWNGDKK